MASLTTETMVITPELAGRFLESQTTNRPLTQSTVSHYARLINEGLWELNGEAIKFNERGNLIDGQHRLSAIVRSGKSIPLLVVRGLNGRAFETLDTGKNRSAPDLLGLEGYSQTAPLSGAARALLAYERGLWAGKSDNGLMFTPMEIVETIKTNPDLVTAVRAVKGDYKEFGKLWSPSYASFLLTIARRQSPIKADQFYHEVSTGKVDNLDAITWVLRQRLMESVSSRTHRMPRQVASGICVKSWVAFRDDKDIKRLKFVSNESFPKL